MNVDKVMSYAHDRHGLLGDLEGPGSFEAETARSVRSLLERGFIERRERTVVIDRSSYGGNWTEMQPVGPTTIVTWHLTDAGREHWLKLPVNERSA
jgi:hypothetical protein